MDYTAFMRNKGIGGKSSFGDDAEFTNGKMVITHSDNVFFNEKATDLVPFHTGDLCTRIVAAFVDFKHSTTPIYGNDVVAIAQQRQQQQRQQSSSRLSAAASGGGGAAR